MGRRQSGFPTVCVCLQQREMVFLNLLLPLTKRAHRQLQRQREKERKRDSNLAEPRALCLVSSQAGELRERK